MQSIILCSFDILLIHGIDNTINIIHPMVSVINIAKIKFNDTIILPKIKLEVFIIH